MLKVIGQQLAHHRIAGEAHQQIAAAALLKEKRVRQAIMQIAGLEVAKIDGLMQVIKAQYEYH